MGGRSTTIERHRINQLSAYKIIIGYKLIVSLIFSCYELRMNTPCLFCKAGTVVQILAIFP